MSFTLYYASDFHGSDVTWKKFLNAGKFYGADVLVMGGDITGKAIVPVVDTGQGFLVERLFGSQLLSEDDLPEAERRIRNMGLYPYRLSKNQVEEVLADRSAIDAIFRQVMQESLARWLRMAEERLAGTKIKLYLMLGNDDDPVVADVIAESKVAINSEDGTVPLGEGFTMYSCGWVNPTPWNTPRELPEAEFEALLEERVKELGRPERAIFNFHCPPYGSGLDRAPLLDAGLKPIIQGGQIAMSSVGSSAVRSVLERHQPALGLHGHIHESRGVARVGRTLCLNPGSAYGEGVLHGALVTLDQKKGVRQHMLVSG